MIRFSNVRKEIKYPRELWIAKEPEFYFFYLIPRHKYKKHKSKKNSKSKCEINITMLSLKKFLVTKSVLENEHELELN